ncbi:bifunctional DNA-formamidopyrimidine glycosylase/DNA-(apurinic or apyrimidinic site) lyase [Aliikangiella maris]|uniref:Bifunctional DNA-formamidopyrimidine glycosylase/DNA-(Apurinic or apyrimidinic site) lyase n=2 Tax=Aliikangiella maris TaxID=3162458 RepID=A0ABV3MSD9_9GAMM
MPELPEVETSCRGIAPHCIAQKITDIVIREKRLRWPVDPELPALFKNKLISSVSRRGKYLLINCELSGKHQSLMIHLGMSGSLRVITENSPINKHDHLDIVLSNGKLIRYNDPRRFGSVQLNLLGDTHPLLVKLGVEPLHESFNTDYLLSICKKRQVAIKALIMNSHVVVGVGNIYAQEALFRAAIHPSRQANRISVKRLEILVETIKQVLSEAIEAGGSSLKDFTSVEGKPGYFQHTHQVYGRGGEPCINCGLPLKQTTIAQRTTVYCGNCQK